MNLPRWLDAAQPKRFFSSAQVVLIFSVSDQLHVGLGNTGYELLGRHDCLQLDSNAQLLEVSVTGRCCVIELTPA